MPSLFAPLVRTSALPVALTSPPVLPPPPDPPMPTAEEKPTPNEAAIANPPEPPPPPTDWANTPRERSPSVISKGSTLSGAPPTATDLGVKLTVVLPPSPPIDPLPPSATPEKRPIAVDEPPLPPPPPTLCAKRACESAPLVEIAPDWLTVTRPPAPPAAPDPPIDRNTPPEVPPSPPPPPIDCA